MHNYEQHGRRVARTSARETRTVRALAALIQARLLHDPEELLLVDLAITIAVSFLDHLCELLVSHVLAELLRHALEVAEGDLPCLIIIEQPERLENLFARVFLTHLRRHHLQEFLEVNVARPVLVDVADHLLDLLLLGLEAKGTHCNLQLLGVDGAGAISIEQVKSLTDLLLLLLCQFKLLRLLVCAAAAVPVVGHGRYVLCGSRNVECPSTSAEAGAKT
mmetsp:Transcript_63798/g.129579  ORF Transcript_63798/g.129579 Transcript_63798/m.129579 type:complete len:220 (+) Transcript_63798:657-1316(+)